MTTKTTHPITGRTVWDNEIEIELGSETYNTVPITFREDMPNNFSEELLLKSGSSYREFEMEWIIK